MRTLVALLVIVVSLAMVLLLGVRLSAMIREVGVLPVRIPQEGRADSLNLAVATAVALYEVRRHALKVI